MLCFPRRYVRQSPNALQFQLNPLILLCVLYEFGQHSRLNYGCGSLSKQRFGSGDKFAETNYPKELLMVVLSMYGNE